MFWSIRGGIIASSQHDDVLLLNLCLARMTPFRRHALVSPGVRRARAEHVTSRRKTTRWLSDFGERKSPIPTSPVYIAELAQIRFWIELLMAGEFEHTPFGILPSLQQKMITWVAVGSWVRRAIWNSRNAQEPWQESLSSGVPRYRNNWGEYQ